MVAEKSLFLVYMGLNSSNFFHKRLNYIYLLVTKLGMIANAIKFGVNPNLSGQGRDEVIKIRPGNRHYFLENIP